MEAKEISKAVIKRLPRYYRYLGELMEENVERISSNDLTDFCIQIAYIIAVTLLTKTTEII